MSGHRYQYFMLAGRRYESVGQALAACETYAAKARRRWRAALRAIVGPGQIGEGAASTLAHVVGEPDGSIEIEGLEPAEEGGDPCAS